MRAAQCSEAQDTGTILPYSQFETKARNHLLSMSERSLWVAFEDHSYLVINCIDLGTIIIDDIHLGL